MKNVGKIFTGLIIVLVLVGVVGLIVKFTNGGTTDFKTFYVTSNGRTYSTDTVITLDEGKTTFETKYLFESNKAEKHKGYKVQIIPNITTATDFTFTVNGETKRYSDMKDMDLSSAFELKKSATGFTVTNNFLSVRKVLETVYNTRDIVLDTSVIESKPYVNIVVSSYDDTATVKLSVKMTIAAQIKLDKDGIVF